MTAPPTAGAAGEPFAPLPPFTLEPRPRVYLGVDPNDNYRRCWSGDRDSVGVVGPPGYGKTAGVIIPAIMWWSGPVVSTSTRGDVLRFCGDWRRAVAAPRGGTVYVYDPFGSEPGLRSMRWSPLADCTDPAVCYRRVAAMTAVLGDDVTDASHWRNGAGRILRGYFHAAALAGLPLREVRGWLARQETRVAAEILRTRSTAAPYWADDLEAVQLLGDRERGSMYSMAADALEATAEPTVLRFAETSDLDVDAFLATCSTLFIVGPSHYQTVLAPMIVGLVDSIAQRAAELAAATQAGRLDPPLLLALDEVPNTAPIRSLPALVSEGGGRGQHVLWSVQNLAQLRKEYGVEAAAAILSASTAKLIYGGMSHGDDLRNISTWAGEHRESQTTHYSTGVDRAMMRPAPMGGLTSRNESSREFAVGYEYRPVLPVEQIQQLPPFHAWLWYKSSAPLLVETRPAGMVPTYRQVAGYTPVLAEAGP